MKQNVNKTTRFGVSSSAFFPYQQIQRSFRNRRNLMGVEASNIITKSSDQSNMGIAIGKRNRKSNEPIMLITPTSKLGLSFLTFFPISRFEEIK